jgi:PBP1b-binding outer membrane lipoprotein LpoB
MTSMLRNLTQLRVLNISNNTSLTADKLKQIIVCLRNNQMSTLTELNLSKLSFANNEDTIRELGTLLIQSKSLRSLSL